MIEYIRENLVPVTETLSPYGKSVADLNRWYRALNNLPPKFIMDEIISNLEKISFDGKEVVKLLMDMGILENGFTCEMRKGIEKAVEIYNKRSPLSQPS